MLPFLMLGQLSGCNELNEVSYLVVYRCDTNGTINGKDRVLYTVFAGETGPEVTAVPKKGYVFSNWDDGLLTASRQDTDIFASFEHIAYFLPETSDD